MNHRLGTSLLHKNSTNYFQVPPTPLKETPISELKSRINTLANEDIASFPVTLIDLDNGNSNGKSSLQVLLNSLYSKSSEISGFSLDFLQFAHPLAKLTENSDGKDQKKYKALLKIFELIDLVAIKLKVSQWENYDFLTSEEISKIKLMDLNCVLGSLINIEVFWMGFIVLNGPLKNVVKNELKELAKLMIHEFQELLKTLQQGENTEKVLENPRKEPLLMKGYNGVLKVLKKIVGINPSVPNKLHQSLKNFECIYRYFEESLLKTCISIANFS